MTMDPRVATEQDVPAMTATIAAAFLDDPIWGWVFADSAYRRGQQAAMWRLFFESGVEQHWVWTTPHHEAVALWNPPGCPELTEPHASRLGPLLQELVGTRSELVLEVFEAFDQAHPHEREHFYLNLLGTDPAHRGKGIGMALLAANLAEIDNLGMPAYLESTNNANLARYASVGFEVHGRFALPDAGPTVTTMWRDPR
jgi:GNAT superfamily N-acetyltransferase